MDFVSWKWLFRQKTGLPAFGAATAFDKKTHRHRKLRPNLIPDNKSAVWVEVAREGFIARGRIIGAGQVTVVSPATREYLVALEQAQAWAASYQIPIVYVISMSEDKAESLWLA